MISAIDRAAELLFDDVSRVAVNVRFLFGGEPNISAEHLNVSAEDLAEQIVLAITQIRGHHARLIENVDEHLTAIGS